MKMLDSYWNLGSWYISSSGLSPTICMLSLGWICLCFFSFTGRYIVQHLLQIHNQWINNKNDKCPEAVGGRLPWGSCERAAQSAGGRPASAGKWPCRLAWAGWQSFLGRSGSFLCSLTVCALSGRHLHTHSSGTTPDPGVKTSLRAQIGRKDVYRQI